jgi:hypothetical protein
VRPVLVCGAAGVLAIGLALAAATMSGTGGSPGSAARTGAGTQAVAFTVHVNGDGSVTFTARDLVDPAAATRALNDAGIAGRVVNITDGCASGPLHDNDLDTFGRWQKEALNQRGGSDSVTVRSSDYRPGGGLLLAVKIVARKPDGRVGAVVLVAPYKDVASMPSCVAIPQPGPSDKAGGGTVLISPGPS